MFCPCNAADTCLFILFLSTASGATFLETMTAAFNVPVLLPVKLKSSFDTFSPNMRLLF